MKLDPATLVRVREIRFSCSLNKMEQLNKVDFLYDVGRWSSHWDGALKRSTQCIKTILTCMNHLQSGGDEQTKVLDVIKRQWNGVLFSFEDHPLPKLSTKGDVEKRIAEDCRTQMNRISNVQAKVKNELHTSMCAYMEKTGNDAGDAENLLQATSEIINRVKEYGDLIEERIRKQYAELNGELTEHISRSRCPPKGGVLNSVTCVIL